MKETLGGGRLGSGGKMEVDLHGWGKSTHNLEQSLKTTMSPGTLVPFLVEPVMPGDEWKIKLIADVMTAPTNGALFGSFKFQADVFLAPLRLYIGALHNNKLKTALQMSNIKLPLMRLKGRQLDLSRDLSNQHIHTSCIMSYLGVRGLGYVASANQRDVTAHEWLSYWDIYKNYYASKHEDIGAVLHTNPVNAVQAVTTVEIKVDDQALATIPRYNTNPNTFGITMGAGNLDYLVYNFTGGSGQTAENLILITSYQEGTINNSYTVVERKFLKDLFGTITVNATDVNAQNYPIISKVRTVLGWDYATPQELGNSEPKIATFPLTNLDDARETLLQNVKTATPLITNTQFCNSGTPNLAPFNLLLQESGTGTTLRTSLVNNQEGLALKTYQSDQFNNWLKTDFVTMVNNASSIAIANDVLFLDQLNMAKKVYEHYNRLVVTSGTYRDYIRVSYDVDVPDYEIPMYLGGLSKEIVFQEVVSNSQSADQPLGTIAGKGTFSNKNKGGYVELNAKEWGTLMGIMSITPRLDYTQGNKWYINLKTVADYHVPAMDGIGYQDLITDQMAFFDTITGSTGGVTFRSAGKQVAWLNYMTSHNRALGHFADENELAWMVLSRRYKHNTSTGRIEDLTQYVDPAKFNYVFSVASRDAMNFWVQITSDITVRRVMSAKQIPAL